MSGNRAARRAAARTPVPRPPAGRYGTDRGGRIALLPAAIAAAALLAGLGLTASGGYVVIRYVVAILTAIVVVFAVQSRSWWWIPPLAAVIVIWNPVVPIDLAGTAWTVVQAVATAVIVAAGATIRRRSGA